MTVLSFPTKEPDEPEEPTPVAAPPAVGAVRARLERVPALPSPARVGSTARWWCTEGARKLGTLIVLSPLLLIRELRPIGIGFGRIVGAWARWCAAARLEAGLAAAEQHSEKNAADLEKKKGSRRVISLIVAVVLTGVVWVVAVRWPVYLALAGLVLVLACDAVGRHVAPVKTHLPPPHRALAKEGVPLTQVTRTLVETGEREGLELGVARAMRYDAARQQYRVTITCLDLIEPKHLRAFERGLGFADHSIRSLATGEATTRELVIRDGDPLADVPRPDWIDTASIADPLPLGVSVTETPFAVTFAGVHVAVIGRTGSGKALALDTAIPTPTGWTTMGELTAGDIVFDDQGQPTPVLEAWAVQCGRPCYEVEFSDGSVIVADADHLWTTRTRSERVSRARRAKASPQRRTRITADAAEKLWAYAQTHVESTQREFVAAVTAATNGTYAGQVQIQRAARKLTPVGTVSVSMQQHYGSWTVTKNKPVAVFDTTELLAGLLAAVAVPVKDQRYRSSADETVRTTREIAETLQAHGAYANHSVRVAAPLECRDVELPIPPYTLGAWLGDGSNANGSICSPDPEVIAEIRAEGHEVKPFASTTHLTAPSWCTTGLTTTLRLAGLRHNKHIPPAYFRASETQRRALLAGLLDTDGTCTTGGCVVFAVTNERLALDTRELIATLGYKSSWNSKPARLNGQDCGIQYLVSFTPADDVFRLPRKRDRQARAKHRPTNDQRYIVDVRAVESVPVRCITVDSSSGLYLAGNQLIPTHNTKGLLWAVIDRLVACRDVVLWGIDLAGGPALPMWRGCIQRAAYNPEDAETVLAAACAEIDRRMNVLRVLAENDDPDDNQDEWAANLGPALVVVIDEFALVAEQNGEKGKLDLLVKVEKILRLGRKCWVTLVLATQKAGNSDLGSTVAAAQIGVKMLMSCTERDVTLMLGTEMRDAGWSPHMLQPATEGSVRDAGKTYVYGPAHHTPDVYRGFAPMTPGEVKARARRRIAEGLPSLNGRPAADAEAVDAVEVPPVLADVEQAFTDAGNPDRLSTAELLGRLRTAGHELDERGLAERLRPVGLRPEARWRPAPGENSIRGYNRADVQAAMGRLG